LALCVFAAENTPSAEVRGRRIYEQGMGSSGSPPQAVMTDNVRVPASVVPCRNCHGSNGEGKPEGGVLPSNLTWEALTKPYGLTHPDGRTHRAYDDRSLRRAITLGIDPSG